MTDEERDRARECAAEINRINRLRGHVLKSRRSEADVMPTEEMADIIAKSMAEFARSERLRVLEEAAKVADAHKRKYDYFDNGCRACHDVARMLQKTSQ